MNHIPKFRMSFLFLILIIIFCLFSNNKNYVFGQSEFALKDDYIEIIIEIEGKNILNATVKENAIEIYPTGNIYGNLICKIVGNETVNIDKIKIGFILLDREISSEEMKVNISLNPGDLLHINQTFTFQDILGIKSFNFISGIYYLKYFVYYTSAESINILDGEPFYMKIIGNPFTSVTGIVSSVAVVYSGITTAGLIYSMNKSIPLEIGNSIENTSVKATAKLKSYYEGKSFKSLQDEVSKTVFSYATTWKSEICPKCNIKWPDGKDICPNCHITLEESKEIFRKNLEQSSLNVCQEIVNSTSILSVYDISQKIGIGTIPTTSIISVLISSGLSLAQPRVGKNWSAKTRKLVFRGLSTALTSVLWIQAVGYEVISLSMLAIAILTATIPAFIISKIIENMIIIKTKLYWGSKIEVV